MSELENFISYDTDALLALAKDDDRLRTLIAELRRHRENNDPDNKPRRVKKGEETSEARADLMKKLQHSGMVAPPQRERRRA